MALYIRKTKDEILRQALSKLEETTPIKATSPGSVARAFTEAISTELGDFYDALDFSIAQSVLSTATARGLDLIGELYNVQRRTLSDLATIDATTGAFYFYIDTPYASDITIAAGTRVYTHVDTYVGRQIGFETTTENIIRAGRTRVFASLKPISGGNLFTAGPNTLTLNDHQNGVDYILRCTNPKPIMPQTGYESDDNYRVRISKSIRVNSGGTYDAIRFRALNVSGVREVKIRQTPYGLGSFEVMVIPESGVARQTVLSEVLTALNTVRPVGVRMYLKQPDRIPVDISVNIIIKQQENRTNNSANLVGRASNGVVRYLNSLMPGDPIVYNRLIQAIMGASESIVDVEVTRYAPNGIEVVRKNFTPKADEQLVPGNIEVAAV